MAVKIDIDSEHLVLIESKVVGGPERGVDEPEPKSEVEEFLIETFIDLSAKPTIKLLSLSPAMRVLFS